VCGKLNTDLPWGANKLKRHRLAAEGEITQKLFNGFLVDVEFGRQGGLKFNQGIANQFFGLGFLFRLRNRGWRWFVAQFAAELGNE
jgi:hypothetical protein